MQKLFERLSLLLIIIFFCFGIAYAASSTDEAVLGNDRWSVNSSGNLVPNANTYSIGSVSQYPASIWVAGSEYTSFAAGSDGNLTSSGLALTADGAPTKFIFTFSTGDLATTSLTPGSIILENLAVIDEASNNAVTIVENSDTLTIGFSGNDITLDSSDGGFIFALTDATDGTVDIRANNDSDDYVSFTTVANVPTIVTAGTCNLEIAPDGGTTVVTGALTATGLTTTAGLTTSTTITLQNSETIVNSTNGTVTVGGATNPILNVLDAGTSNSDATLSLSADAAADNGDVWRLTSDGTTNSLFFENNTSGSQATIATLSNVGLLTLTGGLTLADSEAISNVSDVVILTADDAAATVQLLGYEASAANLRLTADQDDDATDGWQVQATAAGTLSIGNDSTAAGTYIEKALLDSTGAFTVEGSEATAGSIAIWSDNGDDAADKFTISMSAADALTMTTGSTEAISIATTGVSTMAATTVTGATLLNGAATVGDNIADITTFTGKIAGATPMSFDGTTANTVYTIFAMDDPASSSKTITFPAVTGTVKLSSAAVALTPGAAVTLTVAKGTTLYTDTPTDNENQTITFSGAGAAGDEVTIVFTCVGTADEVITFHATLVSSTGTLTCDTTAARYYVVRFISDGTHWYEVSRTAVQT